MITQRSSIRGLAVFCALLGAGAAAAQMQTLKSTALQLQPAAVTVEILDAQNTPLRSVNGTVLREGVIVPSSALKGAAHAKIRTRDGNEWTSENVVASNLAVGIAVLDLPKVPPYAITLPQSGAFTPGSKALLMGGPGAPKDTTSAILYYTFALRDRVDYIATSAAMKGCAPAVDPTGRLLGVTMDLSDAGYTLGFLVPSSSLRVITASGGAPVPIANLGEYMTPEYEARDSAYGLTFRGAILATGNKTEDARNFLNLALKKDPNSADAHFWMGKVLLIEKEYDGAAAEFQKAGAADPGWRLSWHMAGVAFNQGARYLDAEKMYKKALEADPNSAESYCNLGGAYYNQKRTDLAVQAFRKSIELDPRYQQGLAYSNLALVYNGMGNRVEAEKVYQDLVKVNPAWAVKLRAALDGKN